MLLMLGMLAGCDKNDTGSLDGVVPTGAFTVTLDTSQYPTVATFIDNSPEAYLSQWDFGDGTPLVTGQNVTHVYKRAGVFEAQLIVAGRGGTGTAPSQIITVPAACDNPAFEGLTGCANGSNRAWTISNAAGGVTVLDASGGTISASAAGSLPTCLTDDEFTFTSTFGVSYASNGGTYQNGTCGTSLDGSSDFVFRANPGGLPQIVLQRNGAFIGLPDSVVNKTYDIVEANATTLKLQGTNPNGTRTVITFTPQLSGLDRAKQFLTGGSSRTWSLDNTVDFPITVGVESNPSRDYGGAVAGQLPACQADDEFTFSTTDVLTYNPQAETFVAGDYTCQAPRPYTSPYTFGPAVGAGIAQFVLSNPSGFIGVTDAPADRIYRIISIDNVHMVLRAGGPNGQVFQFKMVARP
jgi:PKD repeat protein